MMNHSLDYTPVMSRRDVRRSLTRVLNHARLPARENDPPWLTRLDPDAAKIICGKPQLTGMNIESFGEKRRNEHATLSLGTTQLQPIDSLSALVDARNVVNRPPRAGANRDKRHRRHQDRIVARALVHVLLVLATSPNNVLQAEQQRVDEARPVPEVLEPSPVGLLLRHHLFGHVHRAVNRSVKQFARDAHGNVSLALHDHSSEQGARSLGVRSVERAPASLKQSTLCGSSQ